MTAEEQVRNLSLLRLHVSCDDDPSVVPRILGHLQNINVTPRHVAVDFSHTGRLSLRLDVCGLSEERLTLIAARIGQFVPVANAYWARLV